MGVSLHYRGKIKSTELIPSMISEVEDICKTNDWSYEIFDDEAFRPLGKDEDAVATFLDIEEDEDDVLSKKPDLGLRGITFRPHEESESISLLFDAEGVLKSVLIMLFPAIQKHLKMPWSFTKTQFAGADAHIKTVKLLAYLKKKYFKRLDIKDDGGYYPNDDEETLHKRMGFINNAISTLNDIFENANFEGDPDDVIGKIEEAISQSFKDVPIRFMRLDPDNIPDLLGNIEENKEKKPKKSRKKKKDDTDEPNTEDQP